MASAAAAPPPPPPPGGSGSGPGGPTPPRPNVDGMQAFGAEGSRLFIPFNYIIVEGIQTVQPVTFARDYLRENRRVWTPVGQKLYLGTDDTVLFGPEPNLVPMRADSPMRGPLAATTLHGRDQELLNRSRNTLESQHPTNNIYTIEAGSPALFTAQQTPPAGYPDRAQPNGYFSPALSPSGSESGNTPQRRRYGDQRSSR